MVDNVNICTPEVAASNEGLKSSMSYFDGHTRLGCKK